jgi:tRNA threonylcarbamoyladenosine biosynthesis protein TsaE
MMNTTQLKLNSKDSKQTEQIAVSIGARLRGGESIELVSDLGGGKTTFTRGLARGAGSNDVVSSPTFTISKVYNAPDFQIHHFDFYRLPNAGLASHEVEDLLGDSRVVLVVEWGGVVDHVLPEERITIDIKRTGDDSRELLITYPDELSYLMEDLC